MVTKLFGVQTFVCQAPVEGLDEAIVRGLPGPYEVKLDRAAPGHSSNALEANSVA